MARELCPPPTSFSSPGRAQEVQHLGKRPLSPRPGYACSLGTRCRFADANATRIHGSFNSPGADNSRGAEKLGDKGDVERTPECRSAVHGTLLSSSFKGRKPRRKQLQRKRGRYLRKKELAAKSTPERQGGCAPGPE